MNFRLTAILFGTVFVVGVILLIMSFTGDTAPPTDLLAEELAGVKSDDVDTLEMERENGAKLKIVRVDKEKKRWNIVEPYTARADAKEIEAVVGALLKAKPTSYPELSSNPATHGLQPPSLRVTLRAGEKASTINFGDVTIGGNKGVVFVTTSARPKRPMAVPRPAVEAIFRDPTGSGKAVDLARWLLDFRVKSVFAADTRGAGDDVAAVTLTHKGHTLALEQVSMGGWKFLQPAGWGIADPTGDLTAPPGTFTGVRPLLGSLTSLQALSVADFNDTPTPQQLAEYGLNDGNPDAIKVEIRNKDGETTTAFIGKKEAAAPAPPAFPGAPPPPSSAKYWVRVVGQPGVIQVSGPDLGGLAAVIDNPDPLRDRSLLTVDRSRIDGLDLANGAVKLRKTGPGSIGSWKLYGNPAAGDPTSAVGVEKILEALTAPRTIKSFPAPNPANFGPGETTIRVWAEGFEPNADPKADPKAEPKEKGKPITLTFGKKEGDSVNVRRVSPDGTTTEYFLLPEKVKVASSNGLVDLLAVASTSRLELLDRKLKTYGSDHASKLTVTGAANYELQRDEKPDPYTGGPVWRFVKPDNRKGQTADLGTVTDMLTTLANQNEATRFINETPDAAKLAEYVLAPTPRLKVVVGIKDATDPADQERVYEFGKETADTSYVYARQAGRAAVFTLPKFLYDKFVTADLQDKALFRFDPNQVTSVKFRGWKAGAGDFIVLHFEKNKDGVWTVAKDSTFPNYMLDPAKVTAFLTTLSRTRVKEFVKGPPTPAMGFGDEKESLNVHITIPNHPGIILDLWSLTDGGTAYFAGVSLRPPTEPVVKLEAAPFKMYKDSSAAFAK